MRKFKELWQRGIIEVGRFDLRACVSIGQLCASRLRRCFLNTRGKVSSTRNRVCCRNDDGLRTLLPVQAIHVHVTFLVVNLKWIVSLIQGCRQSGYLAFFSPTLA